MKRTGTWLMLLSVLALLLWWWQQRQPDSFTAANINIISQHNDSVLADQPNKQASADRSVAQDLPDQSTSAQTETNTGAAKDRSFMAIYRDLILAESCSSYYISQHQSKGQYDYRNIFNQVANYQRGTDGGAPAIQIEALERFYDRCRDLKAAVFHRANINETFPAYQFAYPVIVELRKEWRQSKPVTTNEKRLAAAINSRQQWERITRKLSQVSMGEFALSTEERTAIEQQITALSDELTQLYIRTDQVDQTQVNELDQQISTLNERKNQRLPADQAQRTELLLEFFRISQDLEHHLYLGQAEVFFEVIKAMELSDTLNLNVAQEFQKTALYALKQQIPEYLPPSELLFQLSGHMDVTLHNLLVEPASLLFMCYLGDDCGPDSRHVRRYCLGTTGYQDNYASACGLSLQAFYTEHYLSPNQWQDVQTLFNLMVESYAP